jgi:Zn-dependent peptidase ImmA (M78 family)
MMTIRPGRRLRDSLQRIRDVRVPASASLPGYDGIRRRCRQRVRELGIVAPVPFTIDAVCHQVAEHTGRPILLFTMPLAPTDPSGLWVSTVDADFVVTAPDTTPILRQHVVYHELGHIILGHRGLPRAVGQVLARSSYDEQDEREAETCADVLAEHFNRQLSVTTTPPAGRR